MRLNHVRGLARNLTHSIVDPCARLVTSELLSKELQDVLLGKFCICASNNMLLAP